MSKTLSEKEISLLFKKVNIGKFEMISDSTKEIKSQDDLTIVSNSTSVFNNYKEKYGKLESAIGRDKQRGEYL